MYCAFICLIQIFYLSNAFEGELVTNIYEELAYSLETENKLLIGAEVQFNPNLKLTIESFHNYPQTQTITISGRVPNYGDNLPESWISLSHDHGMYGTFVISGDEFSIHKEVIDHSLVHSLQYSGSLNSDYLEGDDEPDFEDDDYPQGETREQIDPKTRRLLQNEVTPNSVPVKIAFELSSKIWRGLLFKEDTLAHIRFLMDGAQSVFGPAGFDLQIADVIFREDAFRPDGLPSKGSDFLRKWREEQNRPANANVYVYMDNHLGGGLSPVGGAYGLHGYLYALSTGQNIHMYRGIFTHELGHMLGLKHEGCGTVMLQCQGVPSVYSLNEDQIQFYKERLSNPNTVDALKVISDPKSRLSKIAARRQCAQYTGNFQACLGEADCAKKAIDQCTSNYYTTNGQLVRCCQSSEIDTNPINHWSVWTIGRLKDPVQDFAGFNSYPERTVKEVSKFLVQTTILQDRAICMGAGHAIDGEHKHNAGAHFIESLTEAECAEVAVQHPWACPSGVVYYSGALSRRCQCCESGYSVHPSANDAPSQILKVDVISACGKWGPKRSGTTSVPRILHISTVAKYRTCQIRCENHKDCMAIRYQSDTRSCDLLGRHLGSDIHESSGTFVSEFTRQECLVDDGSKLSWGCVQQGKGTATIIQRTNTDSISQCQARCEARKNCKGITWRPSHLRCFLLSKDPLAPELNFQNKPGFFSMAYGENLQC